MRNDGDGYVYILTNKSNTVFYVGMTTDIVRRLYEHRHHMLDGFTNRYNITKVIYIEKLCSAIEAIEREKQLKGWRRSKKLDLVAKCNPNMEDIYDNVVTYNPFDYDSMDYPEFR